ncbi:hypothetical protein BX616_006895 [Lobosporangium transversale]|uniref:Uncharacterized protein n=1 Tax=Lobosporangium transversale TaxID=64571 RepID=A0A1Y2GMY0_9FUNG|nr:hypothetical protein BCR41DRAFT_353542 [Lobosporangium transversale]KAF9915098.1 hypothetical protein BX616_006895 [Lobosporangium transversale]ORZ16119.1 hypothetical protein BCR41DRAFT_353542 [Lobosporangium transversale]|eukprot:XP_021881466.1 hypothetical protein BCR41DRAFT_353542 [Lobosporangium transversale]
MTTSTSDNQVVVVDYQDLVSGTDISAKIEEAFGAHEHCLGLLLVSNLPKEYLALRERLLKLASTFAALPEEAKDKTVHAASRYSFGWSCGKEIMNGKPDVSKGSYYANPLMDEPESSKILQEQFPEYCHPNVWPSEDLPELEVAFKELGQFIVELGKQVAKECDKLVHSKLPSFSPTHLQDVIRDSKTTKARLLHYYPQTGTIEGEKRDDMDSWCGWHLDHGSLTGLTSAMYIDESDKSEGWKEVSCPDPEAGLYIRNRGQQVVKASIPRDHLAFQTGEALQLATRGLLAATPHCVRGATPPENDPKHYATLARNTFAVFMQPSLETIVTEDGRNFGEWTKEVLDRYYDKDSKQAKKH